MIEKITTEYPDFDDLKYKINELVDAVNTIQKEREGERFEIQEWISILETVRKSVNVHEKQIDELQKKLEPEKCERPTYPYAEQRKWIGKLCKFRDNPTRMWKYGILKEIFEDGEYPFWDIDCYEYAECEPVKPDDDVVYKGE